MAQDSTTFGRFLLQEALPSDISFEGPVTKTDLQREMSTYARRDPQGYVQTVQKLKKLGDEVSTWEGLSVGLDDISPDYKKRDPIIQAALLRVKAAKTDAQRRKIVTEAEQAILKLTPSHPSDMTLMAKSGGRGSMAQLMKTVASPVATQDPDGSVTPWLITKSYAEGLNPADAWIAGANSRRNVIASSGAVVEPGAVAKVITTNMQNLVVTKLDCGTTEGITLPLSDQVRDRYLAHAAGGFQHNTLLTASVVDQLRKKRIETIVVRSPMTCEVDDGVCQRCMGLSEWGKDFTIGTNVGMRSAQALTEPLTQFALNARHGVRLAGGPGDNKLRGLKGFQVLTEIPQSFTQRAALAGTDGRVEKVERAPQGGWHITVEGKQYYSAPLLKPIVRVGQRVEAGDALTEGVAMPDEVVAHKGIGEGRRYLSHQLTDLYRRQGVDVDRRHTELLARNAVNYVRIHDDPAGNFIPGDVVKFHHVRKALSSKSEMLPLSQAKGRSLAGSSLHFTAGTRITPSVINTLKSAGVTEVAVAKGGPSFEPIMKSVIRTPLLDDDWMGRLAHRYLKKTLVEGAGFGLVSDISSTNPVGAYAVGSAFGTGPGGKYAASEEAEPEEKIVFPGTIDGYEEREKAGAERVISSFTDRGSNEDKDPMLRYDIHEDDRNIAYSSLRPESSEGDGPWISGIYVDPEHRGEGLARQLLSAIEEDHQGQTLRLRARPYKDKAVDTETLMKIYAAMGFESYDLEEPSRMSKTLDPPPTEKTAAFGPVRRALFGPGTIDGYEEREKEAESTHTKTMPGGEKLDIWKLVQALEGREPEEIRLEDIAPSRSRRHGFSPRRLEESDTAFPLIVDEKGRLLDGRHRALKLLEQGEETAQARRASGADILAAMAAEGTPLIDYAELGEKKAAFGPVRRALFGGGREAFEKIKGPKLIGRWGGMDPEAHEARKIWDWLPAATQEKLTSSGRGFFDKGVLTQEGGQRYRALEDTLPMIRKRTDVLDEKELARLKRVGLEDVTDEDIAAIEAARGSGLRRVGRGVREMAFGEAPFKMLGQRYQTGGILGPGGVVFGDLGISPATSRAVRDALDPKEMGATERLKAVGRAGFYGGQDTIDKALSYGLPGYSMYEMAANPEATEGQRGAALGQTLGDVVGWSAGSPFGMAGGTALAGTITELGKRLGHAADPPAKLPAGRLSSPWQDRAQQRYSDALRQHRYSQYYGLARDAGGQALDFGQGVFHPGIVARPQVPHMIRSAPTGTGPMPQTPRDYSY